MKMVTAIMKAPETIQRVGNPTLDEMLASARFTEPAPAAQNDLFFVTNGDLRDTANEVCWPEQEKMRDELASIVQKMRAPNGENYRLVSAHGFNPDLNHGFINSQAMGNEVFRNIPKGSTIIVGESTWEYSHHIVGALVEHVKNGGKLLTVANYSGTWPGLVGQANLNASLVSRGLRIGTDFSTTWSESFSDPVFQARMREFFDTGAIKLDTSHIQGYESVAANAATKYGVAMQVGGQHARKLKHERAIMLGLDFYCMGMDNAMFSVQDLSPLGIGHEFASQSELVAAMGLIDDRRGIKAALLDQKSKISDKEGWKVIQWCINKGMKLDYRDLEAEGLYKRLDRARGGARTSIFNKIVEIEKTQLTKRQLIEQGKMYIAAVRIADKYGAEVIGIQYQQGLKDCCSASDLVEGLLNSTVRPEVRNAKGNVIREGEAISCFNEVDQGCGVDLIFSNRLWKAFGENPAANQEDVRWSRIYSGKATYKGVTLDLKNEDVWVELLSGSCPADHLKNGWKGAEGHRQPGMYFPLGGSTLAGEGKSGEVVISRVYKNENGEMCMNLMGGGVVELPDAERQNRLDLTTKQWPIKSMIRYGVSRDQMLLHPSNHETILYASSAEKANELMFAKAQMAHELGMKVYIWGDTRIESSLEYRAKTVQKAA
jgi:hypothetical protein